MLEVDGALDNVEDLGTRLYKPKVGTKAKHIIFDTARHLSQTTMKQAYQFLTAPAPNPSTEE